MTDAKPAGPAGIGPGHNSEDPMTATAKYAHSADQPCPPDCPTRADEVAGYVSEYLAAYGPAEITAANVCDALTAPEESRDGVRRLIVQTAAVW